MSGLCLLTGINFSQSMIIQSLAVTPAHFVKEQDTVISRTFASEYPNHTVSRSSTCWPRPHLGNSLPLAPSDQIRAETAFRLVCDEDRVGLVLGRHVQVLLPSVRRSYVLRAGSTALNPSARCACSFALVCLLLALLFF